MLKGTTSNQGEGSSFRPRIRTRLFSLTAYDAHKRLINDYILCRRGATSLLHRDTSRDKCDIDVIRENHRFLWDEDDAPDSWEARLAKKYYDKLFKEYCICDLSRYKENKIAMRWRTEQEVVIGKGQFSCGEKQCSEAQDLRSWEVNFAYKEDGMKKNALVKARLCPQCSNKLNYKHKKREITRNKKRKHGSSVEEPSQKKKVQSAADEAATGDQPGVEEEKKDESEGDKIWKEGHASEEKSREEEFEDYLEDLLL